MGNKDIDIEKLRAALSPRQVLRAASAPDPDAQARINARTTVPSPGAPLHEETYEMRMAAQTRNRTEYVNLRAAGRIK